MNFKDMILRARTAGASDLHLEPGTPIVARVRGQLTPLGEILTGVQITEMAKELLTAEDWADFNARGSADISLVAAGTRCRVNFYRTIRGLALAVLSVGIDGRRTGDSASRLPWPAGRAG